MVTLEDFTKTKKYPVGHNKEHHRKVLLNSFHLNGHKELENLVPSWRLTPFLFHVPLFEFVLISLNFTLELVIFRTAQ